MKNFFTTKRLCRAGLVAALYVALIYAFSPFAFGLGLIQIRPAEALCILPLFFTISPQKHTIILKIAPKYQF